MIAIQSARNLDFSKMDSILRPQFNIAKLVNSNDHKRSYTTNNTKQRDDYQDPILSIEQCKYQINFGCIKVWSCRDSLLGENEQQLTYDTNRFPYES